jgi:hypothetical protein
MTDEPPRASGLPAGHDEDDPYDDDDDLSSYPDWWQENAELFRSHEMRPYRPSRFEGGAIVAQVLDNLEDELGVSIFLRRTGRESRGVWTVAVDGEPVARLERERTEQAFTRYRMNADTFKRLVRDAVE